MFEKKKSIGLGFHVRSQKAEGEVVVYCRLSYDGQRTTEYNIGVYAPVEAWNQKLQGLIPDHPLAGSLKIRLKEIKDEHESVLLYQQTQQDTFVPTADTIKTQWKRKVPIGPSSVKLIDAYDSYLSHLATLPQEERKSEKTVIHLRTVRKHLFAFLTKNSQSKLLAEAVTPGWGKQFYDYLRQKVAKDTATRYVLAVRTALNHNLLYDYIKTNGLYEFIAPKAQSRKPIYFLNKEQLTRLTNLPLVGIRRQVRDWALFMCHTGLDYNDAKQVVANPQAYLVQGIAGDKWVYQRLKMKRAAMWGECHIPILENTKSILPVLPVRKQPRLKVINKYLNEMGEAMGLPYSFSSKVCRKTAGAVYMEEGYSMQSIQKILGHQSLAMTEAHYVSIQPSVVDRDTSRIKNQNSFSSVFNLKKDCG